MLDPQLLSYKELGFGITCIDTMLHRPGLAACYLIEHRGKAGFIDTGTNNSVPILLEVLKQKNIALQDVVYVMPTHVHLDHAGGAGGLMQQLPNAQLVIHPRGARHMIDPQKLQQGSQAVYGQEKFNKMFGALIPVKKERVIEAQDGFELDLNGRKLLFIDTPGHARHHFCVYDETSRGLFTGDTFGASYPELNTGRNRFIFPPTTPIQFDPTAWNSSLDRLAELKAQRVFLTHYGMHEKIEPLALQLRQTIDEYADTALEFKQLENRQQRIEQAILQFGINYLLDNQCGLDTQGIKEVLAGDMALNAQGLEHWLTTL